jgi:arylsulfatase A-like enzyme
VHAGRPNILWMVTTQWRAQALHHAGDPNAHTPELDALAARSVQFTQAVTPHPFGPFARAALLTGVLSPENGVRDYFDPLPAGTRTVAHQLGELGYRSAFFGKWHLARRDPAAPLVGLEHARMIVPPEGRGGFDHWEGFESGFQLNDPYLHGSTRPTSTQVSGYQSDVLAELAADWSCRQPGPWFALVSLEAPHPPYGAASAGVAPADPATLQLAPNVPRGGGAEQRARRELAGYYAHIHATDRALGRLLRAVPAGTVIVFTSVHGDMHGAHGLFRKGWPYEESIRVPLLLSGPGLAPRRNGAAISLADLPALTLQLATGQGAGEWAAGAARISMPSVVALPDQCDRVWRGIRTPQRKLVLNGDGTPWLFFDLERDPGETTNLASVPERAGERAALAAMA